MRMTTPLNTSPATASTNASDERPRLAWSAHIRKAPYSDTVVYTGKMA